MCFGRKTGGSDKPGNGAMINPERGCVYMLGIHADQGNGARLTPKKSSQLEKKIGLAGYGEKSAG